MKKQVLTFAILGLTTIAFSQKNEVKALEKAIKSEKYGQTTALINSAEKLISNADPKTKSKFYFLKAKALLNSKNYDGMIKALAEFDANDTSKYKSQISELKEKVALDLVNEVVNNPGDINAANKLYAAYKFTKDQEYLFYAALEKVKAQDFKGALPLFIELKEIGYTGEKTIFKAYNKETKEEEVFPSKVLRTVSLKSGSHIKPTETKTPSLQNDIVKNIVELYIKLGDSDNAIKSIQEVREKNPNDVNLIITEANLYFNLDKKDKYQELIKQAVSLEPNNSGLLLNLGIIAAQQGKTEEAKEYYNKCLKLDGDNLNANNNMAVLISDKLKVVVDEMNNLGTSAADNKRYDALQIKKNEIYNEVLPYYEKMLKVDPKNEDVIFNLKNIYSALGNTAKFKEMKSLLDTL